MKITWEVADGYCGKSRPHYTEISDEDLNDCESDEEREEMIQQAIQDDFDQEIAWDEISRED